MRLSAHALNSVLLRVSCCRMGSVVPFTVVEGPEAWVAADYRDPAAYTYVLTPEDIAELDAAVAGVQNEGYDIKVGTYSLGTLCPSS